MEYVIIEHTNSDDCADLVRAYIREGWVCQGGVSVATRFETMENERKGYTEYESVTIFAQAMIRGGQ